MKIIFACLFLIEGMLYAQGPIGTKRYNGIYISESDYQNHKLTHGFDKGDGLNFKESRKLSIAIKANDTVYKYYHDEIWGYRKNGIDWRLFNETSYQVQYIGKICIYSLPAYDLSSSPTQYFSTGSTAPIHELSRKNLIEVYHANAGFVKKIKELPITTSLEKWDKHNLQYYFIDWL